MTRFNLFSVRNFRIYAWWVLAYTVAVIIWGAYVRATGSGAGCGDHWPLCNGEVIPLDPTVERLIEFSHRLTSGLCLLFVAGLMMASRKVFPGNHPVRRAAAFSLLFVIGEALVGAALVVLQLVGNNASSLRALVIAGHLVNTFLLLYWLTKVVFLSSSERPVIGIQSPVLKLCLRLAMAGFVFTGAVGAVVALGDTLFPAQSLTQALSEELSESAHFLLKLRIWHPVVAVLVSGYILVGSFALPKFFPGQISSKWAAIVSGLIVIQVLGGVINWLLLAPVSMQLFHLGFADVTWIAICFLSFSSDRLGGDQRESQLSP